jgi:hypothetical protein
MTRDYNHPDLMVEPMRFQRVFAMPSGETFTVRPIGDLVRRYLATSVVSIDPFARNNEWATHTNDLDLATTAQHHMDAEAFCCLLHERGVRADLAIFDPPYSPRQVSECYSQVGRHVGKEGTQTAALYKRVRDAIDPLIAPGGVVLSFGWNSAGMGRNRGYFLEEILLVNHGGAHNDTICIAERKP